MSKYWMPSIEKKSSAGIREITLPGSLLSDRKVFLTGAVDSLAAEHLVMQLMYLESQSKEEAVRIYIDSPGGEVQSGLMIYDAIKALSCPVETCCLGTAASMASVILTAGDKGRRFILPHGQTLIHEPQISDGIGGSASSIKNIADSILETRRILNKILSDCTGKTPEEIETVMKAGSFMGAEESVAFGICDEIMEHF